jgi:hypothetical protein
MRRGEPAPLPVRACDSDVRIVARYQAQFRASRSTTSWPTTWHRLGLLRLVMERSLTKTLRHKNEISVSKVWGRYRATWQTPAGPRGGLHVTVERGNARKPLVAGWGGVSLARRRAARATLTDDLPEVWSKRPAQLIDRLRTGRCELCQAPADVEAHHVRRRRDLQTGNGAQQPEWARQMTSRRRKTLIVCRDCHGCANGGTDKHYVYMFIADKPVRELKRKLRPLTHRRSQVSFAAVLTRITQVLRGCGRVTD